MAIQLFDDNYFMKQALNEANTAFDKDEIPIGAVIVQNNQIIARAHNLTETLHDVTAHAEMQAFTAAANYIGGKYLKDCTLYVTVEPCIMCAGAAYWTQLTRLVYGTADSKRGFSSIQQPLLHPRTEVQGGVLREECAELIQSFFRNKREK